ncbi:hypothetical protein AX762_07440 [Alkalibacterium sp. 20]|nr:hypothetical protein AX762_07440 [Alkalibacterium sp. 20]
MTMEIIEKREKTTSTIVCNQFNTAGWHSELGGGPTEDAVIDRIIHNSYTSLSMEKHPCVNDWDCPVNSNLF